MFAKIINLLKFKQKGADVKSLYNLPGGVVIFFACLDRDNDICGF